ncbi:hypothetical protein [Roseivirga misakiensis]|uniref:Uncharacterized protein n=1 Tax=Roseivirga misakiensis TaxID=1563681 RepID=A0A1E5SZC2_9BACT|nr:hypothetical protein [Roseivirga misakiensis]OEK04397.1 hypothetical protein BFP71_13020 [Roseivirga misakiensis]
MKKYSSYFLGFLGLILLSCTPDDTVPTDSLYVLGIVYDEENQTNQVAYWSNGVQTIIPNTDRAIPISIDIVQGQLTIVWHKTIQQDNGYFGAFQVWTEDGTISDINTEFTTYPSDAFEANDDLYIVGLELINDHSPAKPVYWKNGVKSELATIKAEYVHELSEATLHGDELIAVGSYQNTEMFIIPVVWEDNTVRELPLGDFEGGSATSISIDNGITYIGGSVYDRETEKEYMAIWIDGELETIVKDDAYRRIGISKIRVVNNERVFTGWKINSNGDYEAFYYKGSDKVVLENDLAIQYYRIDELVFDGQDIITLGQYTTVNHDLPFYSYSINGVNRSLSGTRPIWINDVLIAR